MMGTKERHFAPLINVSVEQLVPQDHFYRHLERTLDLSFVREFVEKTYAHGGRPSIDRARVFQAATRDVFRRYSFRTTSDAACSRSAEREVVSWRAPFRRS